MREKLKSFGDTIIYCMRLSWDTSHLYFIIRLFSLLSYAILPFLNLLLVKNIIDKLAQTTVGSRSSEIFLLLAIMCLITLAMQIIRIVNEYAQSIHNELLEYNVNTWLMQKTLTIDIEFYDSPDFLNNLQAIIHNSSVLTNVIWNMMNGVSSAVSLGIAFVMIGTYNWLYASLLITLAIPSAILSTQFSKSLYQWQLENLTEERQKFYYLNITRNEVYAQEIRTLNIGDFLLDRYKKFWLYCFNGRKKIQKKRLLHTIPVFLLPELTSVILLSLIVNGIITSTLSIGDFTLFSGLFASLISSSTMTIQDFTAIYEDKLKIETLQKFNSYSNSVDDKGTLTLTELFDLEFRDVSFKYPNTNKYVLENISFKITKMENICFIGSNGSGKSTIIKLLLRFYDATNGEILINNINIKNYSISSLRSAFSVAFQKYINYAFSLRENIKLSSLQDQYWTDIEAYKALELVGSEEFISKLPKGLDTYLHKIFDADGYEASSGEYQKIALARAMNKKCEVLILDEPTASFDPTSEYELYRNLNNKNMNRTTIFISHRLSMVHLCDRIIMMESGRITGIGNHSDLMSSNTKYAELYNLQASAYK